MQQASDLSEAEWYLEKEQNNQSESELEFKFIEELMMFFLHKSCWYFKFWEEEEEEIDERRRVKVASIPFWTTPPLKLLQIHLKYIPPFGEVPLWHFQTISVILWELIASLSLFTGPTMLP